MNEIALSLLQPLLPLPSLCKALSCSLELDVLPTQGRLRDCST